MDIGKTLTWDVNLKAGETKEFAYEYIAPQDGEKLYNLGKAKVNENGKVVFEEDKKWTLISQSK
jgi:hypothetical protein